MHKVILDTDFLIHSVENKVDFFSELKKILNFEYKLYILDKTLDELKNKKNEKLILKMLEKRVQIIETAKDKNVDELVLSLKEDNLIVCTNDKEFKEKLKKRSIPTINLRQGKYLVIQNVL